MHIRRRRLITTLNIRKQDVPMSTFGKKQKHKSICGGSKDTYILSGFCPPPPTSPPDMCCCSLIQLLVFELDLSRTAKVIFTLPPFIVHCCVLLPCDTPGARVVVVNAWCALLSCRSPGVRLLVPAWRAVAWLVCFCA